MVGGGASQSRAAARPMGARRVISCGDGGFGLRGGPVWAGRRVGRVNRRWHSAAASAGAARRRDCAATPASLRVLLRPRHGASGPAASAGVPVRPIAAAPLPTPAARGPAEDGAGAREGHLGGHRGGPEQGERGRWEGGTRRVPFSCAVAGCLSRSKEEVVLLRTPALLRAQTVLFALRGTRSFSPANAVYRTFLLHL